jgi:hypothetical protein
MKGEGGRMRTFLLAAFAAVLAAVPADAATRNFGVENFTKIRVDGPFKVRLTTGVPPFARASGSPNALDGVAVDVRGDTLVIHNNLDTWGGDPNASAGPVEISIGTHDLSAAWLNGSGALSIDKVKGLSFTFSVQGSGAGDIGQVDVDQLSVAVVGTASATLAGRAAKVTAVTRGISALQAARLATKDATIGADGSVTVDLDVDNSATISASGPATVRLSGAPACTVRASASASISGCKSTQ